MEQPDTSLAEQVKKIAAGVKDLAAKVAEGRSQVCLHSALSRKTSHHNLLASDAKAD